MNGHPCFYWTTDYSPLICCISVLPALSKVHDAFIVVICSLIHALYSSYDMSLLCFRRSMKLLLFPLEAVNNSWHTFSCILISLLTPTSFQMFLRHFSVFETADLFIKPLNGTMLILGLHPTITVTVHWSAYYYLNSSVKYFIHMSVTLSPTLLVNTFKVCILSNRNRSRWMFPLEKQGPELLAVPCKNELVG